MKLGPYEVVRELGKGGMGVVYEAHDPRLGRRVALKVLTGAGAAAPNALERFLTEARASGRLDHPGIVRLHTIATNAAGEPFLVLDLIDGVPLGEVVQERGPLDAATAIRIAIQLGRALDYAHREGIVHRDVKPANVLVRRDGDEPLLTDFGLAKDALFGQDLTKTGEILGSPAYMPPEQANGASADARSDVYGLGATLFHMLVGRSPFPDRGSVPATLNAVFKEIPPLPSTLRDGVPRALDAICACCLEKEPNDRYPTMAELVDDLERAAKGVGVTVRLARSTRPFVAAGLGVLLGLVLLGLASILLDPATPDAGEPVAERATEPSAEKVESPPPVRPTAPTRGWTKLDGEAPSRRSAHAMAYDAHRRVSVLFGGGHMQTNQLHDDTWLFDGERWTQAKPRTSPPGRRGHAMAYDAHRKVVVLYGGADFGTKTLLRDLWEWDGRTWREREGAAAQLPGPVAWHTLTWDPEAREVLLYGGHPLVARNQFYRWNGERWLIRGSDPGVRSEHQCVWAGEQSMILFGGSKKSGQRLEWVWQRESWKKRPLAAKKPFPNRKGAVVVWTGDRVVLFGGYRDRYRNDVWFRRNGRWTQPKPFGTPSPAGRYRFAGAWDTHRRTLVVHGGRSNRVNIGDTWLLRLR